MCTVLVRVCQHLHLGWVTCHETCNISPGEKRRKECEQRVETFLIKRGAVRVEGNASHSQLGEELKSGLESPLGGLHRGPFIPGSVQGWEAKGISSCVWWWVSSQKAALDESPGGMKCKMNVRQIPPLNPQYLLHRRSASSTPRTSATPPSSSPSAPARGTLTLNQGMASKYTMWQANAHHPPRLHCSAWSTWLLRAQQWVGRESWRFLQRAIVCENNHLEQQAAVGRQAENNGELVVLFLVFSLASSRPIFAQHKHLNYTSNQTGNNFVSRCSNAHLEKTPPALPFLAHNSTGFPDDTVLHTSVLRGRT